MLCKIVQTRTESVVFVESVELEIQRIIKGRPFSKRVWSGRLQPTERNTVMDCKKDIGMDVHQATISIAVVDEAAKW